MKAKLESGSISAFVVGIVLTLMSCSALVVDGGNVVNQYLRYADLAENAARSGTQELRSLRSGNPTVDPGPARQAALAYLASRGLWGDVIARDNSIVVTVRAEVTFALLSLIGLRGTLITVTRSAEPVAA